MDNAKRKRIRDAIRNGAYVYGMNGLEHVRSDVCARKFTVYFSTPHDIKIAEHYLHGYCVRRFHAGQMEIYLDNLGGVGFIPRIIDMQETVRKLRELGMNGELSVALEYTEGNMIAFKTY